MSVAKSGDKVKVHYTGTLTDGTQFDSSAGREPLEFELGSGMVIPGFDLGVTGMTIGDKKSIHIPTAEAYGTVNEDMLIKFDRAQVPADMELEVGASLNMHQDGTGQVVQVVVREITPEYILLDANHPLAGQDLIFELELVGIN